MESKKKPRMSRLSPGAKFLAKERRKSTLREYGKSRHVVRLSEDTWAKWNLLKNEKNLATHDEFAVRLLQLWEADQDRSNMNPEKTPSKLNKAETHVAHSTPAEPSAAVAGPSFPVSDISESNEGSETEKSDESLMARYLERARKTDNSFIEISYDVIPDERDEQESYQIESEWSDDEVDESDDEDTDDFVLEMTFHAPEDDNSAPIVQAAERMMYIEDNEPPCEEDDSDDGSGLGAPRDLVTERKSLCFEENLLHLARINISSACCVRGCSSRVVMKTKYIGSAIRIVWVCSDGHEVEKWDSQPILRRMRAGDVMLSSAILVSGNNYEKIKLLFKFLGLGLISKSSHFKIQTKHCCPIIHSKFADLTNQNMQKYVGQEVVVVGDGRMDSPGHSAQYCTYTVMENQSKDILASVIIDKRMTNLKSTSMEKEGLSRALGLLKDKGVIVREVVTDASTSIAALLRKEHTEITHSFDTWHGAKNFGKRIGAVAAETRNKALRPWVPDLINHFWYCCRTAQGKEDVLVARWRGAIHHVVDVHEWFSGDGAIEPKCEHDDLPNENTKWLETGSDAHVALTRVMLDTRFLHNLHHYVNFRHTGELETFHEHILMYCAKRFAYTYPVYKARNYLAALDYQFHKDRPVLLNRNGEFRLHRCFSKRTGTYSCYNEKVPKTYGYVPDLLKDILESVCNRTETLRAPVTLTPTDPRKLKRRLSGISPPSTKSLLESKKSRFDEKQ